VLISYVLGQTSVILRVKIRSSTTGNGLTGLTNASSGLIVAAITDVEASTTAYTSAGSTIQTIATLGTYAAPSANDCRFQQVDATNHPGVYEIQLANARYAVSGAKSLLVSISGVSGMYDCDVTIPLTVINPYVALLDQVNVESGIVASANLVNDASTQLTAINARQALALLLATNVGAISGGGTLNITIPQAGVPTGNNRFTGGVDINGNRNVVTPIVLQVPV
jgi:hypothetical protein